MALESGFHIIPGVLSGTECESLASGLSSFRGRGRAGTRHLLGLEVVARIAHDSRLLSIAGTALGKEAVPFHATLFNKSPHANWLVVWHQDTALPLQAHFEAAGWGPWSVKEGVIYAHAPAQALSRVVALRLHIDASTSENGPLRIVPGSHALGVLTDDQIGRIVRSAHPTECVVSAGGILVMRPLHIHSSSKSVSSLPRRVLHIEYSDALDLGGGAHLAAA